jgi:hypothetical protein
MSNLHNDLAVESAAWHFTENVSHCTINHIVQVMHKTFNAVHAGYISHLQAPFTTPSKERGDLTA